MEHKSHRKRSLLKNLEWQLIGLIPKRHRKYYYNRRRAWWEYGIRSLFIPYPLLHELYRFRAKKRQNALRKSFRKKKQNGLYLALTNRQRGMCAGHPKGSCSADRGLTIDHIIPLSKGGSNRRKNLQLLCVKCHREKDNYKPRDD